MPIGILDILNKELGLWFEYDKHNELLQVFKDNVEVCNC